MFKNYFTVAIRNLLRQKRYAFINIFGLALGIACCLLIALFVKYEWSFDRFHKNGDRIYRVLARQVSPNGEVGLYPLQPFSLVEALSKNAPGIERMSGFMTSQTRISDGGHTFYQQFAEVNADFLKMFSFPLLVGDPETALNQPDAVIISEPMARKFFGDSNPDFSNVLGQTLTFEGNKSESFIITAVMQAVPQNSSLKFDFLIPISHYENYGRSQYNIGFTSIYVQLAEHQTPERVEHALKAVVRKHLAEQIQQLKQNQNIRDTEQAYALRLQPLVDVYWDRVSSFSYESHGNPFAAYLLSGIAALVLLIACTNFMTLSIGRSASRAREVGIRKVVGAHRRQLMQQFWGEAILLSCLSLGLAIALTELFLPIFNGLIQKQLHIAYFEDGLFVLITVGLMVIVGLIAGSYPALVLSRFQPVASLKGYARIGGRSNVTRVLVVLQYAVSIALMICTGIMVKQWAYIQNKDLGYDKDHVVVISVLGNDAEAVAERYKQVILTYSQVVNATVSDRNFTSGSMSMGYKLPGGKRIGLLHLRIDPDYVETMGLTVLEGRNFSSDHLSDQQNAILINETLAKKLGMDDPVGKPLKGYTYGEMKDPTIIGVVHDFNTSSLHDPIRPLMMQMADFNGRPEVLIRIRPNDLSGTMAFLKQTWKQVAPDREFRQSFLDENLENQYRDEQRWQRVLTYSALFAIAISCLGLLGLSSLATAQRTKEIGIRKILGASVPNLIKLLSRDFVKLLMLSDIIAWPVAYWAMNRWLANFAYHIHLRINIFAFSGALVLIVALLTVSLQTLKAARSNPVDALKYE